MCCLICCMCVKKEFDISCSIYQGQGEDSPPTPRKSNGKKTVIKKKGCQRICNENYGACCDRNRRYEKELIPTVALALASPKT